MTWVRSEEQYSNDNWFVAVNHVGCVQSSSILLDLQALSNGIYKSCLHRAVVNKNKDRISLAFFVNPREDKVVRPPSNLLCSEETRTYPDFTWQDFRSFTQKDYRVDGDTFENFIKRFPSSKSVQPQVI